MGVIAAIDITPVERKTILALLGRFLPGVEVWTHGSRVKWTSRPDSDLDLVVFARPEQGRQVSALREAFEQSSLSCRIDLAVWDETPEHFRRNIENEHAVVVAGQGEKTEGGGAGTVGEGAKVTTLRLGDVCTKIGSGATPRGGSEVYISRGVALIRSQNVHNEGFRSDGLAFIDDEHAAQLANVEVEVGDVLLNITGDSVARSCRAPSAVLPARVNQHVAIIRPDAERLDPRYLYYHLISPAKQASMLSLAGGGATRNALTKGMIDNFDVQAPPVDEQRAIAAVLGSLDDKIEQNRRTALALERLALAIFRAWFVDFEPVKAKAAGATAFPSMPQHVFDALPTRFVDSDLGPVPERWEVGPLGDYCTINERSVRSGEIAGEIEYVDIASVTVGRLDSVQKLSFDAAPSRARRRVRHGDTIWSCVRPNRRSYLFIHSPATNCIVSTGFAVLSPLHFGPCYLHQLVTQSEFVDYLVANADGSAYPAVRPEHFASAKVLVPPVELLQAFDMRTMPGRDLIASADRESRNLAEMRDYLLPKLISGELRVKDGAHIVLEATV